MKRTWSSVGTRCAVVAATTLAAGALALLVPGTASAAGTCSRGDCLTLDSGVEAHTGSTIVRFDVDGKYSPKEAALHRATLVIHLADGLDADLSKVRVYSDPGPGAATRSGNDITVDLAATQPLPPEPDLGVDVTVTPKPGAAAVLPVTGTLSFAVRKSDPLVTVKTSVTAYNAPQVTTRILDGTSNPHNYSRTGLPRGYTSTTDVGVSNLGMVGAPAGLTLRLTFGGGATLGDTGIDGHGVRWGVTSDSNGTELDCTPSADRIGATCLTRSLPPNGDGPFNAPVDVVVPIAIPADQPLGTKDSLTVSIDVPGDPVPADNSARVGFHSGRITDLRTSITSDPADITVGGSGVVTVHVTNLGPDASTSNAVLDVDFDPLPKAKGSARLIRDRHYRDVHFPYDRDSRWQFELPALQAGQSLDVRFRVTARAVLHSEVSAQVGDATTFEAAPSCYDGDDGDYDTCTITQPLQFVAAAPTPPGHSGDTLAASGSRSGMLLGLAAALLVAGGAAQAAGRRRPTRVVTACSAGGRIPR